MTTQVGGDHYANDNDLGHWDLMQIYNVSYLIGNATKYICRHVKKNGKQDVLKAISYLQKAKSMKFNRASPRVDLTDIELLLRNSGLDNHIEKEILNTLLRDERDAEYRWLDMAILHCRSIVKTYELCEEEQQAREQVQAQKIVDNEKKLSLEELQQQIGEWSHKNFGNNKSKLTHEYLEELPSLLGVVEEAGEIVGTVVKSHQGRFKGTPEEALMQIKDGCADLMIFLSDFASRKGFSLLEVLNNVWATVQNRSQASWVQDKEKEDLKQTVEGKSDDNG